MGGREAASRGAAWASDSLAELSKALASGASPRGRGFEPYNWHFRRLSACCSPSASKLGAGALARSGADAATSAAVKMTAVGFEPTQLALVELESTPLDHSGKLSWKLWRLLFY